MNLSTLSIKRPVLTIVFSIVIVLFGIIGFTSLGVREFPSVDPPIINVRTDYPGASADVIESQITEVLEEAINSVAGIRTLTSISSDGRSSITVEFDLGENLEAAANDIRDKVSGAMRNLPQDADPPVVSKSDADAETILAITVQSDRRSLLELSEIGNNMFKERLQTVPGVSQIRIWGDKKYAMRLLMNPQQLSAFDLTPLDVRNALNTQNVELPSGRIEGYNTELTIRTFGRLVTEEDFNNMIIAEKGNTLIRFKDIGKAELSPENERTLLRGNGGIPMIGIAVTPQPGSNYIAIADDIRARVEEIKKDLPDDITLGTALDITEPIRRAISEVQETIIIAFLLVVLVIFFFLRNWRTLVIPIIAIPISLIGSFFFMYLMDFSINILTLLGVVLCTGLVVDDAIVVMENIYAKVEKGMNVKKAAIEGSNEIIFAILATTITLVCVFLPIIFLQGLTGSLFREFGAVVAGSVVISAFVSLSLTPMMSSKLLRKSTRSNRYLDKIGDGINNMILRYRKSLDKFLDYKWMALVLMTISLAMIFIIGALLPSELAPREDKGRLRIMSTAPEGTSFELMDEYVTNIIDLADSIPETESMLAVTSPGFGSSVSVNSSFVRLTLTPGSERERSQMEIAESLTKELKNHNFARSFVVQDETISTGRSGGLPVQYVVQATNFQKLEEFIPKFMERAQADPAFSVVDLNLKFNKPELHVEIDRNRARSLGVSVADIAQTLQLYFSGQRFGYFIKDGKQYQVLGQAMREFRNDPLDMRTVFVRNDVGEPIQLDNLVSVTQETSPPQLYRYNRYVSATVSANPAEGLTIGDGIEAMDRIAAEVLDGSFVTSLAGTSKEYAESSNSLIFAFGLALILVYLTLAAQFESFRDPLIIMFTVPLALAGAVLSLWLFGQSLNIFSQIGIIVLVGIVTKNGILIVEFANQRKEEGMNVMDAIKDAAEQRLRPILMTSLATVLGALPIALALGDAATSRIPMGIAIIGGLLFSLVLTLYVIPGLYLYITNVRSKKDRGYHNEE